MVNVNGSAQGTLNVVVAGKHTLFADEPLDQGGTDKGMNPYALLLSALGACKSMTVSIYARHKGWPLTHVEVRLAHSRVYAKDCAGCEEPDGLLDQIDCELRFEGALSDEQKGRLMEISQKCPVHKTLMGKIRIQSRMGAG